MEGPLYAYLIGIIVPAALMLVMYVIWLFTLCCMRCCCKQRFFKRTCLFIFVAACSVSILGWILGLAGNVNATTGFNAMVAGGRAVQGAALSVVDLGDQTRTLNEELQDLNVEMDVQCTNSYGVDFPISQVSSSLTEALQQVTDSSSGLIAQLQDVSDTFDETIDMITPYIAWREQGTLIVLIVTLVVVAVFMLSTFLREARATPKMCRGSVRLSSKLTSLILFVFGILLMLIIWIFVAVFHVILTAGADICAPNVNVNVNRIIAELTLPALSTSYIATMDPCMDPTYSASQVGQMACYYQTCAGTSPLGDLTFDVSSLTQDAANAIDDFEQELRAQLVLVGEDESMFDTCFTSIHTFLNKSGDLQGIINGAGHILTCENVNPVYAAVLYDGLCNGVVDSMYFFYVSSIFGCVFLMLAMSIYRTFDHPDAYTPEEGEDDYEKRVNGQVISSGGPVTKEYA